MTSIFLPSLVQMPSPNYTPSLITHDLFFFHMMEGGYDGSRAWLCLPKAKAAAHWCLREDGREVTQHVPLSKKAWAECAFNSKGVSLEIPGFTRNGAPDLLWRMAARLAAWYCRRYSVPPTWARGGQGRGICQHHDLGPAGGGHVDCSEIGSPTWMKICQFVQEEFDAFGTAGPLPEFGLHEEPQPHEAALPPAVVPAPSHCGAERCEEGDTHAHPTPSGFPLGSMSDWQWRLRKAGANPQLAIDGNEGLMTRAAIGTFQRAYGLQVTREVNPTTWARLQEATQN